MKLFLMRHGEAEMLTESDRAALTARGVDESVSRALASCRAPNIDFALSHRYSVLYKPLNPSVVNYL